MSLFQNNFQAPKHGLSFLASLVIHAIMLILFIRAFSTVKIIHFDKKVTNVMIAPQPPEKLLLPKGGNYPGTIEEFSFSPAGGRGGKSQGGRRPPFISEEEGQPALPAEKSGPALVEAPAQNPALISGFRLDKPIKPGASPPSEGSLKLPLSSGSIAFGPAESGKFGRETGSVLRKYLYPDYQGAGIPGGRGSSGSSRPGPSGSRGRVSLRSQGYDLTPWARSVVEQLQRNWLLPAGQDVAEKGIVKVTVAVEKNGEIASVTVVGPSGISVFNQAALNAIALSTPFPKVPDDFREESFEVTLVFEYNE